MDEIIKKILVSASHAPSGENCQPWRFEISPSRVLIFNEAEADMSLYNFDQKASIIAHGALVENIFIASRYFGYSPSLSLFPDNNQKDLIASVEFQKSASFKDPLYDFIEIRATNRKKYNLDRMSEEEKTEILSSGNDKAKAQLIEERQDIKKAAELTSLAEMLVFENESLHDFLFRHLRWTESEEKEKRDGLYIKTLELNSIQALAFRLLKDWKRLNNLNRFGISKKIRKENAQTHAASAAIGAITVLGISKEDFFNSGRVMQRVWLTATKLGLSFQPMTGVTLLNHRISAGFKGIDKVHTDLIIKAYSDIREIFGVSDQEIVVLFRLGRSNPPSAYSSRYSLDKLIK